MKRHTNVHYDRALSIKQDIDI